MANNDKSSTEGVKSDESENVSEEVLEFIKDYGYNGVNDSRFFDTEPIYDYLTMRHNLFGDEILEFLIEKLNEELNK